MCGDYKANGCRLSKFIRVQIFDRNALFFGNPDFSRNPFGLLPSWHHGDYNLFRCVDEFLIEMLPVVPPARQVASFSDWMGVRDRAEDNQSSRHQDSGNAAYLTETQRFYGPVGMAVWACKIDH